MGNMQSLTYLPASPLLLRSPKAPQNTIEKYCLSRFPFSSPSLDCSGSNENAHKNLIAYEFFYLCCCPHQNSRKLSYSIRQKPRTIIKGKGRADLIMGRGMTEKPQADVAWVGRAEDQINFYFSKSWEFCDGLGEVTLIAQSCVY